jgi:AraC-like DNA-binding protein/mannose-6-phosphate isomerase-like protein (cupin superfamily)
MAGVNSNAAARGLGSTVFLHAGRVRFGRNWRMALHSHARFSELIVVFAGQIETAIAGTTIVGRRGDVLFYPVGIPHEERAMGPEPLETAFIGWLAEDNSPFNHWPMTSHDRLSRMRMLADWLLEKSQTRAPEATAVSQHLIHLLLQVYLACAQPFESDSTAKVKAHVRDHLHEQLTLEHLAEVAGMSRYHFARKFTAAAGEPPISFVRRSRVEAARTLLLSTSLPLKAIAAQVGFADEFQLSRVFKRVAGQTPSDVRRGN